MEVHWREVRAARNTFTVLAGACETAGITLSKAGAPKRDLTCYSLSSATFPLLREEMKCASCITVAGGPHVTARPNEVAEVADYVIVGEGEYTLPRLIRHLEEKRPGLPPGVATKTSFAPADTTVVLQAYPPFGAVPGFVEITRGCPHCCAYCQTPQIFGCGMRHRPVAQITRFSARYSDARFVSPNALAYGSDGISPKLSKVRELLHSLKNSRIFFGTFPSEVRPEFVTEESLALITRYCANERVHFGAQSGSDRILSAIGRGHTVADVLSALDTCEAAGISPMVDFIVGLPGETLQDQEATLALIARVVVSGTVHVHRFTPLPGTTLEESPASLLAPAVERVMGSLALRGRLTGSWSSSHR
ncbi:MAG: TIGR04013 family B12-binding domain/radical SAM domain-containing protein [Methanomicrobiales archaeon]|nr:TIGR04013 family B12-binding domain/radical SAM domain-containing protein [Methanomicrobiales archaeon]